MRPAAAMANKNSIIQRVAWKRSTFLPKGWDDCAIAAPLPHLTEGLSVRNNDDD